MAEMSEECFKNCVHDQHVQITATLYNTHRGSQEVIWVESKIFEY